MHGFPSGWKKGGKSQSGGAPGTSSRGANVTAPVREFPVVDSRAPDYNSKLKFSESASSAEGSSTSSSFHATSQDNTNRIHTPWIIDSGATNHMTGASNLFTSYTPCSGKDKVRVADGSMVPITGRGSVRCTETLSLSPTLHVPDFPINLLSVSSITKSLNCQVLFDPSHCAFQELGTGRVLGTGTVHNELYYLDEGSDEVALAFQMSPCQ